MSVGTPETSAFPSSTVKPPVEPPPTLSIRDLVVAYRRGKVWTDVVHGVSLAVRPGETLGLVGESGSGKTTLALAALRSLAPGGRVESGKVRLAGQDLYALDDSALRRLWRDQVGLVPQDPRRSLNPTLSIGDQVGELMPAGLSATERRARVIAALEQVRLADAERVAERYPHQLSGGMLQRVMIAMALCRAPALLVLDEPTTALDVTTEAVILDLIRDLVHGRDTAVLYVTHNLGVVAGLCDRVAVMRAGALVEEGTVTVVFRQPEHPYTQELLASAPRVGTRVVSRPLSDSEEYRTVATPALATHHLTKRFPLRRTLSDWLARRPARAVHAATDVDLAIPSRRTLGLVGESGSGKSTLGLCITGLVEPDAGTVTVLGELLPARLAHRSERQLGRVQMVLQHPEDALNPHRTVGETLARPLQRLRGLAASEVEEAVAALLAQVRLPADFAVRRPGRLSGGERQRVAIARAFAAHPDVLILDEPVSALDVTVQAAILDLLESLQAASGTSYLFISHDLAAISRLADRIAVMYLGQVMEMGSAGDVQRPPHHPYTEALLAAVPAIDAAEFPHAPIRLPGEIPSAIDLPSGCPFHTRCPRALGSLCVEEAPPWQVGDQGHRVRCHIPLDELAALQAGEAEETEG
jgi:peptide/nickel transport system ATP-binding protein